MLGSSVANIMIKANGETKTLAYTGDIGRPENRILMHPKPFPQADILITEATYGDRLHQTTHESEEILLKIVKLVSIDNE